MLRHLLSFLQEIHGLPFVLADKWASEAELAQARMTAIELANEETRRKRSAFVPRAPSSKRGTKR